MKIVNLHEIVKEEEIYKCGSPNLKQFLQNSGIDYINSYQIKKTNKIIWEYLINDELSNLLTIWTNNKNNK